MSSYAIIHVARKQLGLDDDTARDVYEQATGKRSLRAMSEGERYKVVSALKDRGFNPTLNARSDGHNKLTGKYAKKLQALWIDAWNLGIVQNRNDAALIAFVKRQTGVDHVRFLSNAEDAAKAIEAIKGWIAREASVDWTVGEWDPPYTTTLGFKVAWAQWLKLGNDTSPHSVRQFWSTVADILGIADLPALLEHGPDRPQWVKVMNALGEKVRALK